MTDTMLDAAQHVARELAKTQAENNRLRAALRTANVYIEAQEMACQHECEAGKTVRRALEDKP
jgi:hypothetical protein